MSHSIQPEHDPEVCGIWYARDLCPACVAEVGRAEVNHLRRPGPQPHNQLPASRAECLALLHRRPTPPDPPIGRRAVIRLFRAMVRRELEPFALAIAKLEARRSRKKAG